MYLRFKLNGEIFFQNNNNEVKFINKDTNECKTITAFFSVLLLFVCILLTFLSLGSDLINTYKPVFIILYIYAFMFPFSFRLLFLVLKDMFDFLRNSSENSFKLDYKLVLNLCLYFFSFLILAPYFSVIYFIQNKEIES